MSLCKHVALYHIFTTVLLFIDDFLTTYCYVIISQLSAQGRDFPSLC